jgi:hypothetical protein
MEGMAYQRRWEVERIIGEQVDYHAVNFQTLD